MKILFIAIFSLITQTVTTADTHTKETLCYRLDIKKKLSKRYFAMATRAAGTWAAVTTNTQTVAIPSAPSAPQAGDMMIMFYGTKPYDDAPTIDQGWTSLGSATDGTVAAGVDLGSMQARIFYKIHTGSETNPAVTNTTNNISGAVILVFSKAAEKNWELVGGGGGDATAGTGFSAATAAISLAPSDLLVAFAALRSDQATQSGFSLAASGITFSAFTESPGSDLVDAGGGDIAASGGWATVSTGTATAAVTYASTLVGSHTGSMYLMRLREIDPPSNGRFFFFLNNP